METLRIPEDQPIASGMISGAIENAQGKIEGYHFDTRKHVLDYDEVLNKQRQLIYEKRRRILAAYSKEPVANSGEHSFVNNQQSIINSEIVQMIQDELRKMVTFHAVASHPLEWNTEEIFENIKSIVPVPDGLHQQLYEITQKAGDPEALREELCTTIFEISKKAYELKEEKMGSERMRELEKFVLLRTLDTLWMDHLDTMESLRDSVRLRAYGQKDPLIEYKREGHEMFERLLAQFQTQVVLTIFKVELKETPQQKITGQENRAGSDPATRGQTPPTSRASIGRNDPCYCGATRPDGRPKKYKHCHGKNA